MTSTVSLTVSPNVVPNPAVTQRLLELTLKPSERGNWSETALLSLPELQILQEMAGLQWVMEAELHETIPFFSRTLPLLTKQLIHHREPEMQVSREKVAGHILWPATYKARQAQGYDPSIFAYRKTRPTLDSLENQLLKVVLIELEQAISKIPAEIMSGVCYVSNRNETRWVCCSILHRAQQSIHQLLIHPFWQMVSIPSHITESHLTKAWNTKSHAFSQIVRVHMRGHLLKGPNQWPELVRSSRRVFVLPQQVVPSVEPWLRLNAALLADESYL